jgi:hypothetical protein
MIGIVRILIGLTVALALGTSAVASASAAWYVEGTELSSTAALATTAKLDESVNLNVPSLGVKLTCTGGASKVLSATKPYIQAPGSLGAESLILQGCSEITPTSCEISETIATEPVAASVEKVEFPLDRIRLVPKTGKVLASITFEGTCLEAGEEPVDGSVTLDAAGLQEESATQSVSPLGTTENNSLELLKDKSYLEHGKALLQLASGKVFAFFAPSTKFSLTITKTGKKGEFIVKNKTMANAVVRRIPAPAEFPANGNQWMLPNTAGCVKTYAAGEGCSWTVEYTGNMTTAIRYTVEDSENNIVIDALGCNPMACP